MARARRARRARTGPRCVRRADWTQAELFAQADGRGGRARERAASAGAIAWPSRLAAGPEFVLALHGCLLLGAVAVPVDLRLGDAERAALADGCAVRDRRAAGRAAEAGEPAAAATTSLRRRC